MDTPVAPRTVEEFLDRLGRERDNLPNRLKQCATYLLAQSDRVAFSTVAELAQGAQVPPSAMMRFCQIMGFSGYSEMQKLFRTQVQPGLPDYSTRLEELRMQGADSPSAILAEFVDAGRMSLEKLSTSVDPRNLDGIVNILSDAQVVHIMGLRRAFPVASYLTYAFEKLGVATVLHSAPGRVTQLNAMRAGDAVIAITFAPYSPETIELAEVAAARGLPVVSITDTVGSPLNGAGFLPMTVSEVDFGAFRSLSASLTLAISLAVAVGARKSKSE